MHDDPVRLNNAHRTLTRWRGLLAEARAVGATAAANELTTEIAAGEAILVPYAAKAEEHAQACAAVALARERTKSAQRAFEAGEIPLSQLSDVCAAEPRYEAAVNRTRGACASIVCAFEKRARPIDAAIAEARASISAIESSCLSGTKQEWDAVHREASPASAKYEPIFAARILETAYEERKELGSRSFAELRDCLAARARKPGGRVPPMATAAASDL